MMLKGAESKMKRILIICTFIIFNLPLTILAMEEVELGEIVVTATRMAERVENVASSVTVITAEDMEKKNAVTVLDMLRDVQGLDVVQNGGSGKKASLFIRGGNSGHTLVMIDGIQVNSPTAGEYNFADLTLDNVERIEVIRGPQGTLYGSDAMAGVVNIITKKGTGLSKFTISAEVGSFSTYRGSVSLSGGTDRHNYALSVSFLDTDGISTASEENGNTEDDAYENTTLSGRIGYVISDGLDTDITFRFTDAERDMDGYSFALGTYVDDDDYTQRSESLLLAARLKHIVNKAWDHTLRLSLADDELISRDPTKVSRNSDIFTKIKTADWQHNFTFLNETNTVTVGYEYEKQEGKNASSGFPDYKSMENNAFYMQDQLSLYDENLNLTIGARADDNDLFGDETTYKAGLSYNLIKTNSRIRAGYGTGFKAPSMNDLFYDGAMGTGNPDLKPEKNRGYDVGLEQSFKNKSVSLSAVYFKNTYEELIEWSSSFPYTVSNVADAEMKGWEFGVDIKPGNNLYMTASWTITETEDKATGNELKRRPENKGSLSMGWTPEKASINITFNKVGKRWDDADNTDKLDSYKKVDLAASYDITKSITIFGRAENLTDEDYEEAKGYGTAGDSYYAGLKANF
jgi:vitamin B12 transporter